jgi:hypothetical protein
MIRYLNNARKGLRPLPGLLGVGALALSLGACDTDSLVQVSDPARLTPEEIDNASAVPALISGALRQFVGGYSGFGDDSFLSASAVITDEMYYGDTFTTRFAADSRQTQPPQLGNITDPAYARLHQSRTNARRAFTNIARFASERPTAPAGEQALVRTIEGYVYITLSEGWCGNVPFSGVPDDLPLDPGNVVYSRGLTVNEMSDSAVARFNEALTVGGATNLTRIGLARAHQNRGNYAAAAAAVAAVPTNYVFHLQHSPNLGSQNNPMFQLMGNGRYGVSNLEGALNDAETAVLRPDLNDSLSAPSAEGVAYRALRDPRVPYRARGQIAGVINTATGCFTGSIACWLNDNYPNNESDVPLASGVEARLIEAELALRENRTDDMLDILNDLRSDVAGHVARLYPQGVRVTPFVPSPSGLPALTDPGTEAGRRSLFFQERALWLYNTGHRQGDLRRLIRHYGIPANQAFPSGFFFRGGSYGTDVAYPVPFAEENNTQFVRSQCVTSQA